MQVPSSQFDEYTVGLIIANPLEMAAVRAMMDDCHGRPADKDPTDTNSYFLGRIGEHNVVAASLPAGSPGTVSAAVVAAQMLSTFKKIRFGLAIGVGSGVPDANHDIRLGDVVVSTPVDGTGGVVQFDFKMAATNSLFVPTGVLNKPPMVLMTAVTDLQAEHIVHGTQIGRLLAEAAEANPRLKQHVMKPPDDEDCLFEAQAAHSEGAASCTQCDRGMLIERPEHGPDSPSVHYGLIASGSQMRDARMRDKLRSQHRVLCIESEAAGLMDNFSCIVIRGICDYADAHHNNKWKPYAAFTAAAYGKELLSIIPAIAVQRTPTMLGTLDKVLDDIRVVRTAVVEMRDTTFRREQDGRGREVLDWITPANYDTVQRDCYVQREGMTGQWLLHSAEFCSWMATANATLFCPGIPGAGKTIMASIVINHIQSLCHYKATGLSFFYCNYKKRQEQRVSDVIAVLLKQLCAQCPCIPEVVTSLFDHHMRKRTRPAEDELSKALLSVAGAFNRVFVVIDALDEFDTNYWSTMLAHLRDLQGSPYIKDLRLMVTSRHEPELEREFRHHPLLEIRADTDDLALFLRSQMPKLSEHIKQNSSLQSEIMSAITTAADGMFLLAKLHLDSLLDKRTVNSIRGALKSLPKGQQELAVAYDKTIDRIRCQHSDDAELARRVLSWITHAQRPLIASELQEALAVRPHDGVLDPGNFYVVSEMVKVCAGLVANDYESNIIRLVHHTTQDYLEKHQVAWVNGADADIASTCLDYLSLDAFSSGVCVDRTSLEQRLSMHRFASYAAVHWGHHARIAQAETVSAAIRFMRNLQLFRSAWQIDRRLKNNDLLSFNATHLASRLHFSARFGLHMLASRLIEGQWLSLNENDGLNRTPLSYAAEEGHDEVVKLFLAQAEVDVNASGAEENRPIQEAAKNGHEAVLKLLVARSDVDVNSKGRLGSSPLHTAIMNKHEAIARLLLVRGDVDINAQNHYGSSPILLATGIGLEATVKHLLGRADVDVNAKDSHGNSPILLAAENGYEAIVKLLLDRTDVDVNSKDYRGSSPLQSAIRNGHEAIVKLLLGRADVDVNAQNYYGRSAILLAAGIGSESIVKLLLDRADINVNATDTWGSSPILLAAGKGHEAIVKLLLGRADVNVNARDHRGSSPIQTAIINGHQPIVRLLLNNAEVDVNVTDVLGSSPILTATRVGQEGIVKLLLRRTEVDANAKDVLGSNPLLSATRDAHVGIVKLLLDHAGVDVDAKDDRGSTPILIATRTGNEAIVKLLLDRAEVDVHTPYNRFSGQQSVSTSEMA